MRERCEVTVGISLGKQVLGSHVTDLIRVYFYQVLNVWDVVKHDMPKSNSLLHSSSDIHDQYKHTSIYLCNNE